MLIERDAERYERTPERTGYANGFKLKQLKTREGQFYQNFVDLKYQALKSIELRFFCKNCFTEVGQKIRTKILKN